VADDISVGVAIAAGIGVPLVVLAVSLVAGNRRERQKEERQERAVANALFADLKALEGYITAHLNRLDHQILTKESVPIREIKFLRLQSGLQDGQMLRESGFLEPEVARAVNGFYAHLRQNNIILEIVIEGWEKRNKRQNAYQRANLQLLQTHLSEALTVLETHYPELVKIPIPTRRGPDLEDEEAPTIPA